MASINNVTLSVNEQSGTAHIEVHYTIVATQQDALLNQAYRESVQLIGVDIGPGEDGQNEVLPAGTISDGVVVFTPSQQSFTRTRSRNLSSNILDEDPGFPPREDEIRARVTLTPLPPTATSRESNLIKRGAGVVAPN